MTVSEYRNTHSWQEAVQLGPSLLRIAEELPAAEEQGLAMQLRQLAVEVPAAIATDLLLGSSTRHPAALRLASTIELIDRVYPALDTVGTRRSVEALIERLLGDTFNEQSAKGTATPALASVSAPAASLEAPVPVIAPAPEPALVSFPVSTTPSPALAGVPLTPGDASGHPVPPPPALDGVGASSAPATPPVLPVVPGAPAPAIPHGTVVEPPPIGAPPIEVPVQPAGQEDHV